MTQAPLSSVRVLELSRILAGPWAGQTLADYGAEVIKVEKPEAGDDTRRWGPPFLKDEQGAETTDSAYFLSANRGKKSITVDIRTPAGQAVIRDLAARCDVLIENYKVGGLKKYQLDYPHIKAINPKIIYCSITGFGQNGPYAHRPGYDFLLQGMGGLMGVTGERDDLPGGGPQKVGVALTDILTGMYAVTAIQAALIERDRSGTGQHIDLALLDVQVACLANQASNYLIGGEAPGRLGNAHPNIVPYQMSAASDGHFILAVGNDDQFRRFCEVAGCPDLSSDERFSSNQERVRYRQQLNELLTPIIKTRCCADWLSDLEEAGVPCGPVNNIDQVFENPQVQHRQMRIELDHPENPQTPGVANPVKYSKTPIVYESAPPTLGQHTQQVLSEVLDYSPERITELQSDSAI